jgi:hypothetical protein
MDAISIYVDVKSLHELLNTNEPVIQSIHDASISEPIFRAHSLRKGFLGAVISDLIKELKNAYETRSLIQRWVGKARGYHEVIGELSPLNNASDETVKLKVAGYPDRIYFGKIDPSKVDTVGLDFYQLYKS